MSITINPRNLEEVNALIPIVEDGQKIDTGYIVELVESGDVELRKFENSEMIEDETIEVGVLLYDSFDEFLEELKFYVGDEKIYLSTDYALILLSVLNGGYPEDYE